jgi:hypothetical protein
VGVKVVEQLDDCAQVGSKKLAMANSVIVAAIMMGGRYEEEELGRGRVRRKN